MDGDYRADWHPDEDVREAAKRLLDALCAWERDTGRQSVLIVHEMATEQEAPRVLRALSGKPGIPVEVNDFQLLRNFELDESRWLEDPH